MSEISIKVVDLVKTYNLYNKPIDRVKEAFHPLRKQYHKQFYALNNINFEVMKGETVGIIGKNGSGKSTLLKIITGVLSPKSGFVYMDGRVASLLELGAGFNPEMTGMENIYLNGTIIGYSKSEMDAKIDSILNFADIGEFINQPVKMYSSGMFARLAFAVAINVEPDILIIDEALSVGDAKFQHKCFARFNALQKTGTTILLVSHDIVSIRNYTSRTLYLKEGVCKFFGDTQHAVNMYMNDLFPKYADAPAIPEVNHTYRETDLVMAGVNKRTYGAGAADIKQIVISGLGQPNLIIGNSPLRIDAYIYWNQEDVDRLAEEKLLRKNLILGIHIEDTKGNVIIGFNTYLSGHYIDIHNGNKHKVVFSIEMPPLKRGDYFIVAGIALGEHNNYLMLTWYDNFGMLRAEPENDIIGIISPVYKTEGIKI